MWTIKCSDEYGNESNVVYGRMSEVQAKNLADELQAVADRYNLPLNYKAVPCES
jgi:hypothetical protein